MFKFVLSAGLLAACAVLSNGCSQVKDIFLKPSPSFLSMEEANEQIAEAEPCCGGDIFNGQIINVTKSFEKEFLFDIKEAQAFNFPTGKSFFKIFQIPINTTYLSVQVESAIINTTFKPRIDFYNGSRRLISTVKPNAFKYRESPISDGTLSTKIIINNASAQPGRELAYMVVYTTSAELSQSTPIMHPAVKRAKALQLDVPDMPDMLIPHSPIGAVTIGFNFRHDETSTTDNLLSYLDGPLIGGPLTGALGIGGEESNRQEDVVLASGEVYSVSSQREGTTAVISTDSKGNSLVNSSDISGTNLERAGSSNLTFAGDAENKQSLPPMMKETEDMYNNMIKEAVKAGDFEKALKLVSEAQRAGSESAQQAFIDAAKDHK